MGTKDDIPADAPAPDTLAYRLVSIGRTRPPTGAEGRDWVEYKIAQGINIITGCRRGNLTDVTEDVRKVIEGLNQRRGVQRGRVNLRTTSPARVPSAAAEYRRE